MSPEQYQAVIRGMRNPMNSWEKSDSIVCPKDVFVCEDCEHYEGDVCGCFGYDDRFNIGENDLNLCKKLAKGGPVHAKYRRMMVVYLDITAPLYWWKEFDTYKVGTVANSCSTMHKIHSKEFTLEDFSCEHLMSEGDITLYGAEYLTPKDILGITIDTLNGARKLFLETKDKKYWWQMIQLLPLSYNQKRTVTLNYEVLVGMYKWRKNHKLDEWVEFCKWIESLPFAELITMEE
jgi:uncharacterized cysteine cluster protein YcgN (CxxCxxCC family)